MRDEAEGVIRIRRAEPSDADFATALLSHQEVEPFLSAHRGRNREDVLARIEQSQREPASTGVFVIEAEGERAGLMEFDTFSERSRIATHEQGDRRIRDLPEERRIPWIVPADEVMVRRSREPLDAGGNVRGIGRSDVMRGRLCRSSRYQLGSACGDDRLRTAEGAQQRLHRGAGQAGGVRENQPGARHAALRRPEAGQPAGRRAVGNT